jgi:hypothetical protein
VCGIKKKAKHLKTNKIKFLRYCVQIFHLSNSCRLIRLAGRYGARFGGNHAPQAPNGAGMAAGEKHKVAARPARMAQHQYAAATRNGSPGPAHGGHYKNKDADDHQHPTDCSPYH